MKLLSDVLDAIARGIARVAQLFIDCSDTVERRRVKKRKGRPT